MKNVLYMYNLYCKWNTSVCWCCMFLVSKLNFAWSLKTLKTFLLAKMTHFPLKNILWGTTVTYKTISNNGAQGNWTPTLLAWKACYFFKQGWQGSVPSFFTLFSHHLVHQNSLIHPYKDITQAVISVTTHQCTKWKLYLFCGSFQRCYPHKYSKT